MISKSLKIRLNLIFLNKKMFVVVFVVKLVESRWHASGMPVEQWWHASVMPVACH
jgi:hypothetical protein